MDMDLETFSACPQSSPGTLVTTQTGSFERCVDLLQVLVFVPLETLADNLSVESGVAEEIGSVCVVQVCLQASALPRMGKGQRPPASATICSHSYFQCALFLFPRILKASGDSEAGRSVGVQSMPQPCGLW